MAGCLRRRPAWRHRSEAATIERRLEFKRWSKSKALSEAGPPMTLLDRTTVSVARTAAQVEAWVMIAQNFTGGYWDFNVKWNSIVPLLSAAS
jgi:hypothetical protein